MVKTGGSASYSTLHASHCFAHLVLVWMRQQQDGLVAVIYRAVGEAWLIGHRSVGRDCFPEYRGGDNREFAPVDAAVEAD